MKKLTIICVGYNESVNLPKFFAALESCKDVLDITIQYIDQSSTDQSVAIAQKYTTHIYIHPNKGYADPDKKWAVENLIADNELCMILDADDEFSIELAREIAHTNIKVGLSSRHMLFMGRSVQISTEPRIFYKAYINITDVIHNYLHYKNKEDLIILKSIIVSNDMKGIGNEISAQVTKINRYTDKEMRDDGKYMTIMKIIYMPIVWFFGWGIKNQNFFRGMPGWIHAFLMAYYQFMIYAKHYEKNLALNINNDQTNP